MAPDPLRLDILALAARHGTVTLADNRDYASALVHRSDGTWQRVDSDRDTGRQDAVILTADEALMAILWRVREGQGRFGPDDGSVTWADVLAWLRARSG